MYHCSTLSVILDFVNFVYIVLVLNWIFITDFQLLKADIYLVTKLDFE